MEISNIQIGNEAAERKNQQFAKSSIHFIPAANGTCTIIFAQSKAKRAAPFYFCFASLYECTRNTNGTLTVDRELCMGFQQARQYFFAAGAFQLNVSYGKEYFLTRSTLDDMFPNDTCPPSFCQINLVGVTNSGDNGMGDQGDQGDRIVFNELDFISPEDMESIGTENQFNWSSHNYSKNLFNIENLTLNSPQIILFIWRENNTHELSSFCEGGSVTSSPTFGTTAPTTGFLTIP